MPEYNNVDVIRANQGGEITPQMRLARKHEAGEAFGASFLKNSLATGAPLEARGEVLRDQHERNIGSIGNRINRIQSGANLAAQRAGSFKFSGPRGFARQLGQAEKRGMVRQGINERGEKAIRNQQLKDRIALAKNAISRRGALMQTSADAAQIRVGGQAAMQRAADQTRAAYTGMAGAIAGGAMRGASDLFNTGSLSEGMMQQQSDVDSFFGAQGNDVGGLDNLFDTGGSSSGFNFNTGGTGMVG